MYLYLKKNVNIIPTSKIDKNHLKFEKTILFYQ